VTVLFDQFKNAPRVVLQRLGDEEEARRPLPVSGVLAAVWTLGVGLAVLTTLTLIGWMAAPRGAFAEGLPGVFRTACLIWLAAHHTGFAIPGGAVGMLPLGLMALPGFLLYRAGLWMARDADLRVRIPVRSSEESPEDAENTRRRAQLVLVVQAGVSLAAPYAMLAGVIALVARNEVVQPFLGEALISHFALAFATGSIATARTIGPWRSMLRLLPERPRSLVLGTAAALGIMLVAGMALVLGAITVSFGEIRRLTDALDPGFIGGLLLLIVEALYLANAAIWSLAYMAGPGFAVGAGTLVAPTGVKLGAVPSLPLLGALPSSGAAPAWALTVVAVPFAAGVVAGVVVARVAPTASLEAAPLWGVGCGVTTGAAAGLLALLSGGPLGGARLTVIGPSAWEVAFSVALEVGVSAGISAGFVNWWLVGRRPAGEPDRERVSALRAVLRRLRRGRDRALPGHWLDAAEADTQPLPVIRDDRAGDPVAGTAGEAARANRVAPAQPGRPEIVDETDDRGGHVIYVDPYAWDKN